MSYPKPLNITYVTFPENYVEQDVFEYIIQDTDNIINVNTTFGPVRLVLPNIQNSGIIANPRTLLINDFSGTAETNNITIVASGGDTLNDNDLVTLNREHVSCQCFIGGYTKWIGLDLTERLPIKVLTNFEPADPYVLVFSTDQQIGGYNTPINWDDIDFASEGNLEGCTILLIHQASAEPSFAGLTVVNLSGTYTADVINFIHIQYIGQNNVIVTISQEV